MALVINIILVDSAVLEIKNSVARGNIISFKASCIKSWHTLESLSYWFPEKQKEQITIGTHFPSCG